MNNPADRTVDETLYETRLRACQPCDHRTANCYCTLVGAALHNFAHQALAKCPIGRWERLPATDDEKVWAALAWRGQSCEFRQLKKQDGCCGPRYRCQGGRHDGQLAEPISVCVACMRDFDATLLEAS